MIAKCTHISSDRLHWQVFLNWLFVLVVFLNCSFVFLVALSSFFVLLHFYCWICTFAYFFACFKCRLVVLEYLFVMRTIICTLISFSIFSFSVGVVFCNFEFWVWRFAFSMLFLRFWFLLFNVNFFRFVFFLCKRFVFNNVTNIFYRGFDFHNFEFFKNIF